MATTNKKNRTDGEPIEKQKLFLLEFIVEDINLDYCTAKQLICYGEGPSILEFSFLDMGPFTISEDDFMPVTKHYLEGCTGTGNFKNGKSVLFGLTPKQIQEARTRITLLCEVGKQTKKKYSLGIVVIPLINLFNELVDTVDAGGQKYYACNTKDCFKIKSFPENDLIGHIFAYIRMSCFNELIVNKFNQIPKKEFDYKAEKGFYNFKYNKTRKGEKQELRCECGTNIGNSNECTCPAGPADNCPEIWMDNKCVYDCPPQLRPCEPCPEVCGANKKAGKMRQRSAVSVKKPSSTRTVKSKKMVKKKGGKKE